MRGGWAHATKRPPRVRGARRAYVTPQLQLVEPNDAISAGVRATWKTFPSRREAKTYIALAVQEREGLISGLECQVNFPLFTVTPDGLKAKVCTYRADFVCVDVATGKRRVIDSKGWKTELYLLKKKWLEAQAGIVIEEV